MAFWPQDFERWAAALSDCVEVLGIVAGAWVFFSWTRKRLDRSTQVLFQLERKFNAQRIRLARMIVEDDLAYRALRSRLLAAAFEDPELAELASPGPGAAASDAARSTRSPPVAGGAGQGDPRAPDPLEAVDALLRFFVFLRGIFEAKQVQESALRACYRYWLAQYYNPCRRELRLYIDRYYPTLRRWLADDRAWTRRLLGATFFTPHHFRWTPERRPSRSALAQALAGRVLVITGAGVSAESGLATYRGRGGYWKSRNPRGLARRSAFEAQPDEIWDWYDSRREEIVAARPGRAHELIDRIVKHASDGLLVTQNVDDLHDRVGGDDRLVHIHGEILVTRCTSCRMKTRPPDAFHLRRCPECGERTRPGVIWFDEDLDPEAEATIEAFLRRGAVDVVIVVGTSASFDYIARWAIEGAGEHGWLLEINPERTPLSSIAHLSWRRRASVGLARLARLVPAGASLAPARPALPG